MARDQATPEARTLQRRILGFLCAFCGIFAGLALLHGVGPSYSKAHAAIGNAVVHAVDFSSGVRLNFDANDAELEKEPWHVTLHVEPPWPQPELTVPIDLRSLAFLPSAAFIALGIAVPLRSVRAHLSLLGLGLLILEPLLLGLVALPLLSFLGGTGPVQAFTLSRATHVLLQVLYRALVTPPGMAYAIPFFLWWGLVALLGRRQLAAADLALAKAGAGDRFSKRTL